MNIKNILIYAGIGLGIFFVLKYLGVVGKKAAAAASAATTTASNAISSAASAVGMTIGMSIDQNNPNVTRYTGTAAVMTDVFVYKVPRTSTLFLRTSDSLSAYFKDAVAETVGTDAWELVVRDPNQLRKNVIASGQYTQIKEFQDSTKKFYLPTSAVVPGDWEVALRLKATTVIVVASGYQCLTGLLQS